MNLNLHKMVPTQWYHNASEKHTLLSPLPFLKKLRSKQHTVPPGSKREDIHSGTLLQLYARVTLKFCLCTSREWVHKQNILCHKRIKQFNELPICWQTTNKRFFFSLEVSPVAHYHFRAGINTSANGRLCLSIVAIAKWPYVSRAPKQD